MREGDWDNFELAFPEPKILGELECVPVGTLGRLREQRDELAAELKWVYAKLYSAHKDLQEAGLPISDMKYVRVLPGGKRAEEGR